MFRFVGEEEIDRMAESHGDIPRLVGFIAPLSPFHPHLFPGGEPIRNNPFLPLVSLSFSLIRSMDSLPEGELRSVRRRLPPSSEL